MTSRAKQLVGLRFGKLVVQEDIGRENRAVVWRCLCDCGAATKVITANLVRLHTQSCGCLGSEARKEANTRHGQWGTKAYWVWNAMLDRCTNKNNKKYGRYGGRGISVCREWFDFRNFLEDMGECPETLTLDRINNSEGYSKGNCRWATVGEQNRNHSRNRHLTFKGRTQVLTAWAQEYGISPTAVFSRLKRGWPVDRAIETPLQRRSPS